MTSASKIRYEYRDCHIAEAVDKLSTQSELLICELTESAKDQLARCIESLTGTFSARLKEEIAALLSR